jgi:hypothetical protein
VRVCNSLPAAANTLNSSFDYNRTYFPFTVLKANSTTSSAFLSCMALLY